MKKNKMIKLGIVLFIFLIGLILFIIYITNKNYIKNVNFYLNGDLIVEIEEDKTWIDPLFEAEYNNESIKDKVIVDNNVDFSKSGIYKIKYTIKKGFCSKDLIRTIIVKEKNEGLTLTLKGNDTIYLSVGTEYIDPGVEAYNNDIEITDMVSVNSNVDTNKIGNYLVEYRIEIDSYVREAKRAVNVVSFDYQLDLENNLEYTKENKIVFSTSDDNYDYALLPNGNKEYNKIFDYPINENGEYKVLIYNKLGFYNEKVFVINNIDKEMPKGICNALMYDKETKIVVEATDDIKIVSYEYIYGNKNSGLIAKNEFKYTDMINEVSVNLYDVVNNKVSIKCNMLDKSTKTPSSYKSYTFIEQNTSRKMDYWLYIPNNLTNRSSVPLLIYLHGDGGRGNNINLVNNHAFPKFIKNGQEFPFMMIAGQISNETNWTNESTYKRLMNLVNSIVNTYNVNPKKIMLAGGSSGGGGVYVITSAYPKYFSCAVVGSGIYSSSYRKIANNLIYTPMWIFHGTDDKNIDYSSVKSFSDYISSLGGNVIFKGIEEQGHNVTETSYGFNNQELINWMISQERN